MYLIRTITDMSLVAIGRVFSRDHTTVLNSLTNVENELVSNPSFSREINEILTELKN